MALVEAGAKQVDTVHLNHVPLMDDVVAPMHPSFRQWKRNGETPLVVNVSTRNICEIPSQLAEGFLRYTDWSYWAVATWVSSWLHERMWWQVDYEDPDRREQQILRDLLRQADYIHLNGYHTWDFLRDMREELTGKRMVIHHHGCELRDDPMKHRCEADAGYMRVVSTPDLLLSDYGLHWLPSPVPIVEIERNYPRWTKHPGEPCVIGHAYTVKENKGSDTIEVFVERARQRAAIWYMPWHGVQRRQSIWLLSQCDVFFSTMFFGPGLASYEAMAMGIPVVLSCTEAEYEKQCECYGGETPFWRVTYEDAEDVLVELAKNPTLRAERGARGKEIMRAYHDLPAVVERMKGYYEEAQPCRTVLFHE